MKKYIFLLLIILIYISPVFGQIPSHPSKLKYESLKFEPPDPDDYRIKLDNGMIIYIMEDRSLPMIRISARLKVGSVYDPEDKLGLASMTGSIIRRGGTTSISGEEIDEKLAFLGASVSSSIRTTSGSASLFSMSKDFDEVLKIYADVIMNPAFEDDKIRLYKDEVIDNIKQMNDSPSRINSREFNTLLYKDHPVAMYPLIKHINNITRNDLIGFHKKYFAPNNMIMAVAGDFNKKEMIAKIETAFKGFKKKNIKFPKFPKVDTSIEPGVYMIQKDINQGYLRFGHFGIKRDNRDYYSLQIMNFILGGGSFTSRITSKVRSDEGLSYSQGSRMGSNVGYPGLFYAYIQTKSSTVVYAIKLMHDLIKEIRKSEVDDAEMETAINTYIGRFPDYFSTSYSIMSNFASLEFDNLPKDYYKKYRQNIQKVTKKDVLKAAKKYLNPDKMAFLIVGDVEKCREGYLNRTGKKIGENEKPMKIENFGSVKILELPDPEK
jgi:predicted Zn-dependent peptidase